MNYHVLTPDEARQAGYTGWCRHMDHMRCIAGRGDYCATCQSPMRALLRQVTGRPDLRHLRSIHPIGYPDNTTAEGTSAQD